MTAPGQSRTAFFGSRLDWLLTGLLLDRHASRPSLRGVATRGLGVFGIARADLVGVLACALTFALWNAVARGALLPSIVVFFVLLCLACMLSGRLFARLLPGDAAHDVPTAFVIGFLLLNSALYLLAWVSPFSIITNAYVLLAVVIAAHAASLFRGGCAAWPITASGVERTEPACSAGPRGVEAVGGVRSLSLQTPGSNGRMPAMPTLVVSLVAATLWCWDSIAPQFVYREGILLRPFLDSSFHACEIRMFRDAHGAATLEDLRMAGQPVWIYHHASYLAPALVSAATGTSAYLTFGSFYLPSGVVLTGLAAHALLRSLWGPGAGLAAMTALFLIPGPARYGLSNFWLSYRWHQQVNPGGNTGVSILAIAWLLMFAGCRVGRLRLVVLGLLAAGLSANYKAHLFVANALLIWLYPGVFFRGARWRWKLAWLAFGVASFVAIAALSQRLEEVPTLRLDCSSVKHFMTSTTAWCERSAVRRRITRLITPTTPLSHDLAWGAALLFYGSLGIMGVANLVLALIAVVHPRDRNGQRRVELEYAVFPIVVAINYLVMALGLAYDTNRPEHGDELRHRPLVWAYFVSAAWAGALTYRLLLERAAIRWPRVRRILTAAVVLLLYVPYTLGENAQAPTQQWRPYSFRSYPRALYESARYIQTTAEPDDIVQASDEDPLFVFSALCERRAYAITYFESRNVPTLKARIAELNRFKAMTDAQAIQRFVAERRIRYYVLHPDTKVGWPKEILDRPDFRWGGIRVFSFPVVPASQ